MSHFDLCFCRVIKLSLSSPVYILLHDTCQGVFSVPIIYLWNYAWYNTEYEFLFQIIQNDLKPQITHHGYLQTVRNWVQNPSTKALATNYSFFLTCFRGNLLPFPFLPPVCTWMESSLEKLLLGGLVGRPLTKEFWTPSPAQSWAYHKT